MKWPEEDSSHQLKMPFNNTGAFLFCIHHYSILKTPVVQYNMRWALAIFPHNRADGKQPNRNEIQHKILQKLQNKKLARICIILTLGRGTSSTSKPEVSAMRISFKSEFLTSPEDVKTTVIDVMLFHRELMPIAGKDVDPLFKCKNLTVIV